MDEQDKNSSRRSARSTAHHATTNNTTTNATTANAAAQNANNNNNINNTAKGTTTIQTTETTGKEEKQHPIIHYRIGEILTKHFARKLMKKDGGDGGEDAEEDDSIFEVRIPAECAVSTNRQVRGHQLWGTDVYTSDSDLVAVLMHCGYYVQFTSASEFVGDSRACSAGGRRVGRVSEFEQERYSKPSVGEERIREEEDDEERRRKGGGGGAGFRGGRKKGRKEGRRRR